MARKRAGGGTAYAVSLVIFVILFVFSLIIAILLYTQSGAMEAKYEKLVQDTGKLGTPTERNAALADRKDPKATVLGSWSSDMQKLKSRIINNPTASMEQISQEIEAVGVKEGFSLLREIQTQRNIAADSAQRVAELTKEKAAADEKVKAAVAAQTAAVAANDQNVKKLSAELDALRAQHTEYEGKVSQDNKTLAQDLLGVRTATAKQVADIQSSLKQKEEEIEYLKRRNKELEARLKPGGGGTLVDPATAVDGTIAATLSDQGLVYITRGKKDRILPGLTFEVFDKVTGVTKNEVGDIRGKGTIEVINVGDTTSVARIVRSTKGKPIVEGDLIVNAVYDPNARFKFVVFGEFDIDNTGQATTSDRRRIETMITQWGGILTDELGFDTDFLILGQEPKVPEALDPRIIDPEKLAQHAAQEARYKQYQALTSTAKTLAIPVLNQNRFLALVGYYRR